ncbi:MAG: Acetyl-coenzyme A synthetase [Alphaproteobacteria bacterium MarineAlpha9_Bin5]|nr:MAG: Acetyl-coenzyme A synthetase [Alphaproteobacteria bacterium MarineAlpha9_Bin6]PPR38712.1 MAG: Acetyl-coenzyme A synthetase [Alphaproteobacteria bacterium MarineAlpha9_Bin5]HHZ67450.1 propionyl-CoA synthetase [Alphaproteobacteria bacterium]HIO38656.1 propionyl-CoA synthetase [Rhodospirillales bacterium]HIA20859.1 propionyl-CoA synthetase [Alphaproteobacteria bacterium]
MSRYDEIYARAHNQPELFWEEAAEEIHWYKKWDKVLDRSNPPFYRWFPGGAVNTCYDALDRHIDEKGHGDRLALIYDSPVTDKLRRFSYAELRQEVALFAGALSKLGVGKGDRVLIYMPMVPQTVVAMLASARIGAIHSVVFGGFAAPELATRIDDAKPKVIVAGSCGIEPGRIVPYKPLLDAAIELADHKPQKCLIMQREEKPADLIPGRDIDWNEAMENAQAHECVPVDSNDPVYILYTSGTTGIPKGIVRDSAGHMVALKWTMTNTYDTAPGEVYWAASDVGWVVGHSYIVYGPLLQGCTSVLYEGKPVGTPDAGAFWRVMADHKVKTMFTAPTALRAIKREDPDAKLMADYDLTSFKALFLAGERADPTTVEWAARHLGTPVIDHWWQTETGWSITGNFLGLGALPIKYGSSTKPAPGFDLQVLNEQAIEVQAGEIGALSVKLPMPPGCLPTLWKNDEGYISSYLEDYPGYYKTGDAGYVDEEGYVWVMTRTDDIINVAGHRLSTGAMEEVLAAHPDVAECAVMGVHDELKGQVPLGLMVLKVGVNRSPEEIVFESVQMVRDKIGPVASFKTAIVVKRLPKTRSGKILRGTMQKIADNEDYRMPATIDDPDILEEIAEALATVGYPQS